MKSSQFFFLLATIHIAPYGAEVVAVAISVVFFIVALIGLFFEVKK